MSNLLEKASIITTPTAYSDGVLHSVKPEQTLGSELVTNGDFATDSDWTYGSSWSIGDGKASFDFNIGGASDLRQNSVLTVGKKYKLTFDVLDSNGGNFSYSLGGSAIFINNIEANTTYTVYGKAVGAFLTLRGASNFIGSIDNASIKEVIDADFTFTRNDAGTRVNASGNIESVGVDLPRIDYRGGSGSLLLEPEALNTATDSNDFTTGDLFVLSSLPGVDNGILTSAQATSPDGTNNAWKLVDNNDGNIGIVSLRYFSTRVITNDYNTVSLFVKKQGDNDWFYISLGGYDFTSQAIYFDISNGTLGNVGADVTASIDDYGNGWYRLSVTFQTTTDVQGAVQFRLASSNGGQTVLRDGTNGAYIYGIQAESHATRQYATSYIPTSGDIQTRAADIATDAGSSDLISSTEGVLYAEIAALTNEDSTYRVIALSNGNSGEFVFVGFTNINNIYAYVGSQSIAYFTPTDATDFHKVAIKYEDNNCKLFINGVQIGTTNTTATVPSGLDILNFDSGLGGSPFDGNVKCVAVFKEALTDAELTCLTTPNISRIFNDRVLWDGGIIESLECVTL